MGDFWVIGARRGVEQRGVMGRGTARCGGTWWDVYGRGWAWMFAVGKDGSGSAQVSRMAVDGRRAE